MTQKCQLCGKEVQIPAWSEQFSKEKYHPGNPYICQTCQDRIQSEAKDPMNR